MSDINDTQRVGFTFIWKIENFSLVAKLPHNESISSPTFTVETFSDTSWYITLRLTGCGTKIDAFSFHLIKTISFEYNVMDVDYELSVLANGTSTKAKCVTGRRFHFHMGNAYGTPLCITPQEVFSRREILPCDTLTVQCKMWYNRLERSRLGFILALTRLGAERKSFTWTIDKFSTLKVNDKKSVSVKLRSNLKSLTITAFLTGTSTNDEKIQIKFGGNNEEAIPFIIGLGISVLNVNGKAVHHSEEEFKFSKGEEVWPFPLILEKKELVSNKDLLLPNDVLSIKCDLVVFSLEKSIILHEIEHTTYGADAEIDIEAAVKSPYIRNGGHSSTNSLTNDMRTLFEDKYLSDISLRVHNEVFSVHKAVLAARSSVFKTMFDTDMKEKYTNIIEIDDLEVDTIRRLLLYIYSDTFDGEIHWESASSLYLAAEKYAIVGLKEKCSLFFKLNLSVTNACETFFLADMLADEDLKNSALNFIERNDKDVMNSNEWKDFSQKHLQLTNEILSKLYRKVKEF